MKKSLLSFSVVLTAILSLVLFTSVKGEKTMNDETSNNPVVIIETTMGNITVELDAENAPNSTANFLAYVDDDYFTDTTFHRVIPNFMIQGGGITADMSDKPSKHAPIQNEANNGLKNDRGTLAMARTNDPHSATSQFFINHKNNDFLNFKSESMQGWGYAVFGKVTDGMDIVDDMAAVKTGNKGGHQDVPLETISITGVKKQ
ncbi:MAG: peptidyl-prolyl cis-trans isomerase [Gammaproteobacteria bacterium]|jgi:cyclophilin family peptidyl-prolyl cis-trans isomerase|nr:peptidyl-prolyl cis-trans isomerase [Gammaproteobacteria bacterium]MBT7046954.1 peptidyl-prolyl cis-trans isomerase [Gammaproteobacteria bacterium]